MLTVVDYGAGNLGSMLNMLKKAGHHAVVASEPETVEKATRIILPGVGSFDHAMQQLKSRNLIGILNQKALKERVPVLGVCLGVQLFTRGSEEGHEKGLGWFEAETVRFKFNTEETSRKIPHMGWNEVKYASGHPLFNQMEPEPRFYFVHSYHLRADDRADVLCTARYGYDFPAGLSRDNIAGVQFHPEKSHKYGMRLLQNFCTL